MNRKVMMGLAVTAMGACAVVVLAGPSSSAGKGGGPEADSVRFDLNFPLPPAQDGPARVGHVVYCGVQTLAEPFELDVLVTNPPALSDPEDPTSPYLPGHDGAGWLDFKLQDSVGPEGQEAYRVPMNDSLAFSLTLGGRPNGDQLVRLTSLPLGDADGGGNPFHGVATVLAQAGATDPFVGDGRTDNYCVSIGIPSVEGQYDALPGEYLEGQISTVMPVPDDWVVEFDGDGSDGGVLAGFPH